MDRIYVEGITFVGHHGVSRSERAEGHQMWVDVVACLDTRAAAAADRLGRTVDHVDLARMAHELGTSSSFKLLETLADRIARAILDATAALSVEVRVRKQRPILPGLPSSTGVTIARGRDGAALEPTALRP
jgi:dihydroneopterin aldolase